jgi:hypothetical protein
VNVPFQKKALFLAILSYHLFEINTKDCMAGYCVGKLLLNGIDVNLLP